MDSATFIKKYNPYRWTKYYNSFEDTIEDFILNPDTESFHLLTDRMILHPNWQLSTAVIEDGKLIIKPGNKFVNREGFLLTEIEIPEKGVSVEW